MHKNQAQRDGRPSRLWTGLVIAWAWLGGLREALNLWRAAARES
ncbi:hypothetical protein HNP55_002405 [Paucibacter oligotrophus]|uniref:Uncharacterized protein n=1 Tax=Roseateles oligotrophus TaxID=1769250 RepID=A0A840LB57_9BURK|nr:hypothetical protein [Roseateles oligotrophus]MBB4843882.1 hypothetical protein [Roseateles oligotrophus]